MSQLPPDRMIPILPCRSIDDQISFYESLGFEVTYRQKAPNVLAASRRGAIELQFFTMKGYEPADSYSTCYVMVSDVDRLYFGQPLVEAGAVVSDEPLPRLERALAAANLLLYSKSDPATAARVVDNALVATPDASDALRVRAWVLRADAAHALGDDAVATAMLDQVVSIDLEPDKRAGLADELARAEELRLALA